MLERNFVVKHDLPQHLLRSKAQFRIMQWNGLAKSLCNPKNLNNLTYDWECFRKWRLLQELVRYNCDIMCLEEADFYNDIRPYLHSLK
jgi:mRNA deadenylase 3'-5' endonuclease subunit Ccr4